jgi:hypothetical protein
MSETVSGEDDAGTKEKVLRTVTPSYFGRPDAEMTTIGWALLLGMVIILIPLLPFVILVWLITTGIDFIKRQTS